MKIKKIFLVVMILTIIVLVSCNYNTKNESTIVHEHSFSNEWSKDDDYHWHSSICEHNVKKDYSRHDWNDKGLCSICGEENYTEGVIYSLSNDKNSYYVSGVNDNIKERVVIAEIYNDKCVTGIGSGAFSNCWGLREVVLPNSIITIGSSAFSNCILLTSITIPSSVKKIDTNAFYGCVRLVEVINKSSLNIVKDGSAGDNNSHIAYYALKVKTDGNSEIVKMDNYLFYSIGETNYLIAYLGNDVSLALPKKYKGMDYEIYKSAFLYHIELTTVIIPESVKRIGSGAFSGCYSLATVVLPLSIDSIGTYAFASGYIQRVFYYGNSDEWHIGEYEFNFSGLLHTLAYHYSEMKPTNSGNYWHYVDNVPTLW